MTEFAGARWWKLDIHTHTPASADFGKGPKQAQLRKITPADWLRAFMDAEIDAVVVTDHNTGAWIDPLKSALEELRRSGDARFRELVLFPGVEITAHGGAHILAIMPPDAATERIVRLLAVVGFHGGDGASDLAADSSPIEVVRAIAKEGGIPVLAHVDAKNNSAFNAPGNSIAPLLAVRGTHAVEVCQRDWLPPESYKERAQQWPRLLGSDSHHLTGSPEQRYPGTHFTWVKMETPSYSGLRLALVDDEGISIRRSDEVSERTLNAPTHAVIEGITITDARYCGRGQPLQLAFSPWLTTLIGGRGSGKSTIVELLRLALRRDDVLPRAIKKQFDEFRKVAATRDDRGALRSETRIDVLFRKDRFSYAIRWAASGSVPPIEEERDGAWAPSVGEVRQRFPVRIFSQGEIFELASDPQALLSIIGDAPEVNVEDWRARWQTEETRFLAHRAKLRELAKQLEERTSLEGSLEDVSRKLAVFEEAAHAQVLKDYQRAQRQRRALEDWSAALADIEVKLRAAAEQVVPIDVDRSPFEPLNAPERDVLAAIGRSMADASNWSRQLSELADRARDHHTIWATQLHSSSWSTCVAQISARYDQLVADLVARGIPDIGQYGTLVQQRRLLEDRLRALDGVRATIAQIQEEAERSVDKLRELRAELTDRHSRFLEAVLRDNPHVRMTVEPFGNPSLAEEEFRKVIRRPEKLTEEILSEDGERGLWASLYRDLPNDRQARFAELAQRIQKLKQDLVQSIDSVQAKGWLVRHLRELPPEAIDRLLVWFPQDELIVSYAPAGDGRKFRPIEQGSPGQKTAAILAFLLTHGDEPIILDQPEDDLDNELIYGLIVKQLRRNKTRRQVIIVTHNPNIVINGDAELIVVMHSAAGQCRIARQGSLQSQEVRDSVCDVMEGGREALQRRYHRMLDGDPHV